MPDFEHNGISCFCGRRLRCPYFSLGLRTSSSAWEALTGGVLSFGFNETQNKKEC